MFRSITVIVKDFKKYPFDYLSITLLYTASPVVYLYGTFTWIPTVFSDLSQTIILIAQLVATWIFVAVISNLFLIRKRHSSVRGKFLTDPVLVYTHSNNSPQTVLTSNAGVRERLFAEEVKNLGQQFLAKPHGSDNAWHICSICETYVPNGTWHCSKACNTCILRRDHHCVFAMACIGEENHSNFLGLLLYLSLGAIYATTLAVLYLLKFNELSIYWFLFRSFFPSFYLFYDFSFLQLLVTLTFVGSITATPIFIGYFTLALRGQTSAERRLAQNKPSYSFRNLENFLGKRPLLRIIWPFHEPLKSSFSKI